MRSALRNLSALAFAIGLLTVSGTAQAQDSPTLSRIVEAGVVRVGMSGSQPPFNATSRDGSLIGLEVDLAALLAQAMRVELFIVTKPFGQLQEALAAGEVDMVLSGMAITPERAQTMTFAGPYMLSGKSLLTKSATIAEVEEAGELDQATLTLAALNNSTSQQFVERFVPNAQLVLVDDYDQGVQLVMDGQATALIADMPITLLTLLRYPNAGFVTLDRPLTIEPIGVALPANDPQFANLIQRYLDTIEGMGLLDALRAQWLEDGSWIAALP